MRITYVNTYKEFLISTSDHEYCVFVLSNGFYHLNSIDFPSQDMTFIKEYSSLDEIIIELSTEK